MVQRDWEVRMTGSGSQIVADAEYEQTLARAAAVDVAKATGMECVRGPNPDRPSVRLTRVWEVSATTALPLDTPRHGRVLTVDEAAAYLRIPRVGRTLCVRLM
jgi:hypothetical protein